MLHREGFSCDSCKKDNIRGNRYKCLVCFEYYSCSTCYDSAASSLPHKSDHSMQRLISKKDCELLFGSRRETNNFRNNYATDGRNRTPRNQNNQQSNSRALVNGQFLGDEIIMDASPSRSSRSTVSAPQPVPQTKNNRRIDKVQSRTKVQSLPYYAGAKFSDPPPPNSLPMPPKHWITRSADR